MMKKLLFLASGALIAAISLIGISYYYIDKKNQSYSYLSQEELAFNPHKLPLGLPPIPWPEDNQYTKEKYELGKLLYFDKRLSSDGSVSCASCHAPQFAYADPHPTSTGIDGKKGTRNSPTVINTAYNRYLFWDGRADSLEHQAMGPLGNPNEMTSFDNVHDAHRACEETIEKIEGYQQYFIAAFGDKNCSMDRIANAIATFERTILSGNAAYDRYVSGDKEALTPIQKQGLKAYTKAGCFNCHNGNNFTDGRFINIGVGMDAENPDLGRYVITKKDEDWGAFKVPTLRDIEKTGPYMHDGKLATLEEVVEYYDKGGTPNKNLHPLMKPLNLSESEKKAIVEFMKALNGDGWQHVQEPTSFPL